MRLVRPGKVLAATSRPRLVGLAGLAATMLLALSSCGRGANTALDLRLTVSGTIDQLEVKGVLVGGTPLDLGGEQTLFPGTPRMLVTGDVLTIWFADSTGGKEVTVDVVGRRCGQVVTDATTTAPRTLAKARSTPVDLALVVNRSAGCDGGSDVPAGTGGSAGRGVGATGSGGAGGGPASGTGGGGAAGRSGGGTTGGGGTGATGGGGAGMTGTGGTGAGGTGAMAGRPGSGGVTSGGGGPASGTGGLGTGGAGAGGRGTGGSATGGAGGAATCTSSPCGTKPNGTTCGGGGECVTGNCVDGVCCDTTAANCMGCKACNLTGSLGICANVAAGTDPHSTCPDSPSNCAAGGCTAGACTPAANTVVCSSACASTNQRTTKVCNGVTVGCSNAPATAACPSNLVCMSATACYPNCTAGGDAACVTGYYCSSGACTAKVANGQPCTANNQCTSGACTGFHRDADDDKFGVAAITKLCGTMPPAGYVTDATDCCDADANVKPGQANWFMTGSLMCAGTFDYNCLNGPETQYGTALGGCADSGACTPDNPTECNTTTGWYLTAPGCGGTGMYVNSCAVAGADCNSQCPDFNGCGRGCTGPNLGSRMQGCH